MTPIKNVVKVAKDYIYLQCLQNIGKIKKYFCDIIRVRRTPDFVTGYLDSGIPVNYLKIWYFDLSKIYKSRRENSKSRKFFKMLIINIKISMKNKKGIKDNKQGTIFLFTNNVFREDCNQHQCVSGWVLFMFWFRDWLLTGGCCGIFLDHDPKKYLLLENFLL